MDLFERVFGERQKNNFDTPRDLFLQLEQVKNYIPKAIRKAQEREGQDYNTYVSQDTLNRCSAFLQSGIKKYENGDYFGAYKDFEASNNASANADAWHHKGVISMGINNFEKAFSEFTASILLYPKYTTAYLHRAEIVLHLHASVSRNVDDSDEELLAFAINDLRVGKQLGSRECKEMLQDFGI